MGTDQKSSESKKANMNLGRACQITQIQLQSNGIIQIKY